MWLRLVGSRAKCVLVFDALNQLDDGSGEEGAEHDLLWIPKELPPGICLVMSTLPGRVGDTLVYSSPSFRGHSQQRPPSPIRP